MNISYHRPMIFKSGLFVVQDANRYWLFKRFGDLINFTLKHPSYNWYLMENKEFHYGI